MHLRRPRPRDRVGIQACLRAAFDDTAPLCAMRAAWSAVAVHGGRHAGVAVVDDDGTLAYLYVQPPMRERGLGTRLLHRVRHNVTVPDCEPDLIPFYVRALGPCIQTRAPDGRARLHVANRRARGGAKVGDGAGEGGRAAAASCVRAPAVDG